MDPSLQEQRQAFAERLDEAMRVANHNQRSLAEALGVSVQTVRNWLYARHTIQPEIMEPLTDELEVEVDELWPGYASLRFDARPGRRPLTLQSLDKRLSAVEKTLAALPDALTSGSPPDPAKLRQEAAELAGQDGADAPTRKRGRGRKR